MFESGVCESCAGKGWRGGEIKGMCQGYEVTAPVKEGVGGRKEKGEGEQQTVEPYLQTSVFRS